MMSSGIPKLALFLLAITIFSSSFAAAQSGNGKLTGKVSSADGKPMAGVVVIATNQTSPNSTKQQTKADGSYSIGLRSGAYRISVAAPYEARFDRGKTTEYGAFSNIICDETKKKCATLENVIIDSGERKIDFVVVETGKANGYVKETLRSWYQAIYEVLLGSSEGPRFGPFIELYGIPETRVLIERGLKGEFVKAA